MSPKREPNLPVATDIFGSMSETAGLVPRTFGKLPQFALGHLPPLGRFAGVLENALRCMAAHLGVVPFAEEGVDIPFVQPQIFA